MAKVAPENIFSLMVMKITILNVFAARNLDPYMKLMLLR